VSPLARLGTVLSAFLGSILALFLILPLGLAVVEWIVLPLALAVGALLAALGAGWTGTWLARDGTRTRLAAVVAAGEATALLVALAVLAWPGLEGVLPGPRIVLAGLCSLLLTVGAVGATWRFRAPAREPHHDPALTLVLLAAAAAIVPGTLVLAALAGLTGA
jgi:hypothetical protein